MKEKSCKKKRSFHIYEANIKRHRLQRNAQSCRKMGVWSFSFTRSNLQEVFLGPEKERKQRKGRNKWYKDVVHWGAWTFVEKKTLDRWK